MTRESIYLNFSDPDMARVLADTTPPEGQGFGPIYVNTGV